MNPVVAPLSPAVALLAPPLEAPLTTTLDVERKKKKYGKNLVAGAKEIEKKEIYLRTECL
jgi:hypothetical protein